VLSPDGGVVGARPVIDIHFHLLPGIDDGPSTMDEALKLARAARREGVSTVAATPHLRADHPLVKPTELAGRVAELDRRLVEEAIDLRVVAGGEVDIFWAHDASDEDLRLVSYDQAGSDLLVETPYGYLSEVFEELVTRVRGRGFRVTLAHPERNPTLRRDPSRLAMLVTQGVLVQLNTGSLIRGAADRETRKFAVTLVREGLAHVLASDSHHIRGGRSPNLAGGVEAVERVAPGRALWMAREAPAAILEGANLPPAPRVDRRSRRGLMRLLGR
jgi:protein-tyrosine phosphatase